MRAIPRLFSFGVLLTACASSPATPPVTPPRAHTSPAPPSAPPPDAEVHADAALEGQSAPPVSAISRNTSALSTLGDLRASAPSVGSGTTVASESRVGALRTSAADLGGTSSPVRSAVPTSPRESLSVHDSAMRQCIRAVHARTLTLRISISRSGTVTHIDAEAEGAAAHAVACVSAIVRATAFDPQPMDTTLSLTLVAR